MGCQTEKAQICCQTHICWTVFLSSPASYAQVYLYSWKMQSSSPAKGLKKKTHNLCHNYPFQLLLTLTLERFPAKDYWCLVLVRKRKKKKKLFSIKKRASLKQPNRSFQGSLSTRRLGIAQNQKTQLSIVLYTIVLSPNTLTAPQLFSHHYEVFYTFITINRDPQALKPYVLLWGLCLNTCLNQDLTEEKYWPLFCVHVRYLSSRTSKCLWDL